MVKFKSDEGNVHRPSAGIQSWLGQNRPQPTPDARPLTRAGLHISENTKNKDGGLSPISLASQSHSRDEWSCKGNP